MKYHTILLKGVSKSLITVITAILLLTAVKSLLAGESLPDPPQLNTPDNAVLIVRDHNRQFFSVVRNAPIAKIVNDGNRDFFGLIGILTIITLAYWLVEHETRKSNYYHPTANRNQSCRQCQYNHNEPK